MTLLELGGGTRPHPRTSIGIDLHHPVGTSPQDATVTPWCNADGSPVADGSVDEVFASHFVEHVPKGAPLISVMNEAWRVLRPLGSLTIVLPIVGYTDPASGRGVAVNSWHVWSDPTHVALWWLPESVLYFCEGAFRPNADYGVRVWSALGNYRTVGGEFAPEEEGSWWSVRNGWEGVVRMVKPGA